MSASRACAGNWNPTPTARLSSRPSTAPAICSWPRSAGWPRPAGVCSPGVQAGRFGAPRALATTIHYIASHSLPFEDFSIFGRFLPPTVAFTRSGLVQPEQRGDRLGVGDPTIPDGLFGLCRRQLDDFQELVVVKLLVAGLVQPPRRENLDPLVGIADARMHHAEVFPFAGGITGF